MNEPHHVLPRLLEGACVCWFIHLGPCQYRKPSASTAMLQQCVPRPQILRPSFSIQIHCRREEQLARKKKHHYELVAEFTEVTAHGNRTFHRSSTHLPNVSFEFVPRICTRLYDPTSISMQVTNGNGEVYEHIAVNHQLRHCLQSEKARDMPNTVSYYRREVWHYLIRDTRRLLDLMAEKELFSKG